MCTFLYKSLLRKDILKIHFIKIIFYYIKAIYIYNRKFLNNICQLILLLYILFLQEKYHSTEYNNLNSRTEIQLKIVFIIFYRKNFLRSSSNNRIILHQSLLGNAFSEYILFLLIPLVVVIVFFPSSKFYYFI